MTKTHEIKAAYDANKISFGVAVRKLVDIGFTRGEACEILHPEVK